MSSNLTVIPEHQLSLISGGHAAAGTVGLVILALELPHIFMGFREFVNYVGERWNDGCQNIEENDYFTHFLCGTYSFVTGTASSIGSSIGNAVSGTTSAISNTFA